MRRISSMESLRKCGHVVTGVAEFVEVRIGDDDKCFCAGVQTCSSVWACPVCSAAIREARAKEVEAVATAVMLNAGSVMFLTLTSAHHQEDRLSVLLNAGSDAWRNVVSSRGWRETPGLRGSVRAVEITDGFPNGWHPHVHALVFFAHVLTAAEQAAFAEYVTGAWTRGMDRAGRFVGEHGVRAQRIRLVKGRADVGEYLAKVQDGFGQGRAVGHEMTRGDLKSGRKSNRFSPFELADRAARGDKRAHARWLEYEQATKGKRCLEWSRSPWMKRVRADALVVDQEDEALAVTHGGRSLVELTLGEWYLVAGYGRQAQLLTAAERHGVRGVMDLLRTLRKRESWELSRASRAAPVPRAVA
jgi:hypothetical protein